MAIEFSADEMLSVALRIERNGAAFYRAAAERIPLAHARRLLNDLADREKDHERVFAGMQEDLTVREKERPTFDPESEEADYLRALADEKVFPAGEDPVALIGSHPRYEDILMTAIRMEKDSIAFYAGMRQMIPEPLGRSRVDAIIKEEMGHVTRLKNELVEARK